jgi:hypothetical protein
MNTAYSKEGLIQAMQAAAQSAGISLVKLEIDDSEFPFLVGVVFAKPVDKEKLKEQLGKVPAYALSGGVGGIPDSSACVASPESPPRSRAPDGAIASRIATSCCRGSNNK